MNNRAAQKEFMIRFFHAPPRLPCYIMPYTHTKPFWVCYPKSLTHIPLKRIDSFATVVLIYYPLYETRFKKMAGKHMFKYDLL